MRCQADHTFKLNLNSVHSIVLLLCPLVAPLSCHSVLSSPHSLIALFSCLSVLYSVLLLLRSLVTLFSCCSVLLLLCSLVALFSCCSVLLLPQSLVAPFPSCSILWVLCPLILLLSVPLPSISLCLYSLMLLSRITAMVLSTSSGALGVLCVFYVLLCWSAGYSTFHFVGLLASAPL